jgi:glycerol-3-phosphate dehydrogenase (NAD+)
MAKQKKKVAVIGSGNWGSAVARHIARNILLKQDLQQDYETEVDMWVFEETLKDGRKLTEVINTDHVNVKYLPDASLPVNLVAKPELADVVKGASVFILIPPHQFVRRLSKQIAGMLTPEQKKSLVCVNFAKGIEFDKDTKVIRRMSQVFQDETGVRDDQLAALSGPNIANEVASDMYCETSIASPSPDVREDLYRLFHTDNFTVELTADVAGVELGGALKNIVAIAAGLVDGLGFGNNTKATVVRTGLMEMIKFGSYERLGHLSEQDTFFGPAGLADLITTCFGGRNRMFGEALGRMWINDPDKARSVDLAALEARLLGGQKVQGAHTAQEVFAVLQDYDLVNEFPVFKSVYQVCFEKKDPREVYRRFREGTHAVMDLAAFMADEIAPYAQELSKKYEIPFNMVLSTDREALVTFDPFLLKSVLTRMLGKAFRHTRKGGEVAASVQEYEEQILVNVRNQGKGIPRTELDDAYLKMKKTADIVKRFRGEFFIKPGDGGVVDMGLRLPRA